MNRNFLLKIARHLACGAQKIHRRFLKVSRPAQSFSFPVCVVGSPHIGGAGRTQFCKFLIEQSPFPRSEILVLSYDVLGNSRKTDDALLLESLGVQVVLTKNRTQTLSNLERQGFRGSWVLCDGGWEDPGLHQCIRIGIYREDYQDDSNSLWPQGDLRSLSHQNPQADIEVYWSPELSPNFHSVPPRLRIYWQEQPLRNSQGQELLSDGSHTHQSALVMTSGAPKRLQQELERRGFSWDKIVALRDHSPQVDSVILDLLHKDYLIVMTSKESVKCSQHILQHPQVFLLQDSLKCHWDSDLFWSYFSAKSALGSPTK